MTQKISDGLQAQTGDQNHLLSGRLPRLDHHSPFGDPQAFAQKFHQGGIGRPLYRRGLNSDFQCVPVWAHDLGALGPGITFTERVTPSGVSRIQASLTQ